VLAKIVAMPAPDRAIGERLRAIIRASAPDLSGWNVRSRKPDAVYADW
jgi:hypothetical protein